MTLVFEARRLPFGSISEAYAAPIQPIVALHALDELPLWDRCMLVAVLPVVQQRHSTGAAAAPPSTVAQPPLTGSSGDNADAAAAASWSSATIRAANHEERVNASPELAGAPSLEDVTLALTIVRALDELEAPRRAFKQPKKTSEELLMEQLLQERLADTAPYLLESSDEDGEKSAEAAVDVAMCFTDRGPSVGGGDGGTSCVSNSPLTSSSGVSVHEAHPPRAAATVATAPLGLIAAVDAGDRTSTARIMRLDPVAPSWPSSSAPHAATHHTLRLRPSAALLQPPPSTPQLREHVDEEVWAPPSKRLRPHLSSPTAPPAMPPSATAPGGLSTTGGVATASTNVSARGEALKEGRGEALEESESTRKTNEEAQRALDTPADGPLRVSPASPAGATIPNPEATGIGAVPVSASAAPRPTPFLTSTPSRAVSVNAPNAGSPLTATVGSAVSQQPQQTRSAAPVAMGTSGFSRLRSLTPTPYPGTQGSPYRRHRFVGVNLPGAPPPSIDFSSIQRTVKEVYEVHEKLSEGTYGEVFKGVDKRTGAAVALKRIKMLSTHQGFPQTSLREVIALRHIQNQRERLEERLRNDAHHRGAVAITDPLAEVSQLCDVLLYDRQQRDIVLVFAYATASLAGLCRRQFAFTPSEMALLMKKLLIAVRKLHEMRIIHRDIKSDNVLVTSEGEVQLTDFGLCSIAAPGSSRSGTHVWRTPSVITLAYRPPEMLLGSTAYDEKVDVWSLGCLLAQMFLLEPPFYRHRAQAQQQQQRAPERSAATELEQLSRITEILGPLPPVSVYHPDSCQHMRVLEQLEVQGRLAEAGRAAQPANWGRLQTIFEPSFLYQQFHGFRGWFEAELGRSRHQPHRRPTQACMDVLCAALQLDPQQRPTAAELLRMPYFTTLDDAPLLGSYQRVLPVTPEREAEVRRGFMAKVQRCGDSHTQRRPHQ
ncbi:Protein kinase domain family protein [Leishmania donovani]|uniref:Protein kinase domain family protein n=1 Tax=Leishmania donovani TaxID=5661 RepID=A0A504X209_LEIDO|nr:Protein kinase domain family protein [Leishmania donovani]